MDIRIKHIVPQEMVVKTIAFMMYYSRPRNGNYTWSIIKEELTELLTERGMEGTRELLNEERFREYDEKSKWEYEELGLKGERRREMLKESNKNSNRQ
jgi:hypothetical protein